MNIILVLNQNSQAKLSVSCMRLLASKMVSFKLRRTWSDCKMFIAQKHIIAINVIYIQTSCAILVCDMIIEKWLMHLQPILLHLFSIYFCLNSFFPWGNVSIFPPLSPLTYVEETFKMTASAKQTDSIT